MIHTLFKYHPVLVRFVDRKDRKSEPNADLYCTALSRSIKKGLKIVIDTRVHGCAGGDYFVGGRDVSKKEMEDVYINKERVFEGKRALRKFISLAGQNPIKKRYVIFEPINRIETKLSNIRKRSESMVVIGITTSSQVGRILGLTAYGGDLSVDVVPAISTCSALFRPLIRKNVIHLNFVDYFDREYQCRGFYEKDEVVVSMTLAKYRELSSLYPGSPHGAFKPRDMNIVRVKPLG